MHSQISSKTIREFRPKIGFQTKTVQNPYPLGAAHAYITEYPPWLSLDKITWEDQKFKENGPHHWLLAF